MKSVERILTASYIETFVADFRREVQHLIDASEVYKNIDMEDYMIITDATSMITKKLDGINNAVNRSELDDVINIKKIAKKAILEDGVCKYGR